MNPSSDERLSISVIIISISVFAWILLLINPGHILTITHCHVSDMGSSPVSLQMLLLMNPVPALFTGWGLMAVAMMFPSLILPIWYIYGRSLKRRRFFSALLFVLGYFGVWMAAGLFMIAAILSLHLLMPGSYLPAIGAGIIAILWQFSPVKQRCLNRGHDHPTLTAFGWPASRDALWFGLSHGLWCVGSGWAIMLFPMLLSAGHDFAMITVTFIMLSEHAEHPQTPHWRARLSSKLIRMLFAQTRIHIIRILEIN